MANTTIEWLILSSSAGQPVLIAATGTPGTALHSTGISATVLDFITLIAVNTDTTARKLTVEFGGTGAGNIIEITIPPESGEIEVCYQKLLTGDGAAARNVKAFCATTNVVNVSGVVKRVS